MLSILTEPSMKMIAHISKLMCRMSLSQASGSSFFALLLAYVIRTVLTHPILIYLTLTLQSSERLQENLVLLPLQRLTWFAQFQAKKKTSNLGLAAPHWHLSPPMSVHGHALTLSPQMLESKQHGIHSKCTYISYIHNMYREYTCITDV